MRSAGLQAWPRPWSTAARAATTAASTSAGWACTTRAMGCSVCGEMTSIVSAGVAVQRPVGLDAEVLPKMLIHSDPSASLPTQSINYLSLTEPPSTVELKPWPAAAAHLGAVGRITSQRSGHGSVSQAG